MALTLYYASRSPPCQQVLLTAKALNLDLNLKTVDPLNKEHLLPEFIKLNPQHTIPTLVDGDFALWESRAISRYLVNKYGAGTNFYPQEPQARALVDQRLDFDFGSLYQRFADYFFPQFHNKESKPEESKLKKLEEALGFLNTFLEGNKYVAGSNMTIADFAIVATISIIDASDIDLKDFPNVVKWFELMKTTAPGYEEAIQKNVETFKLMIKKMKDQ